MDQRTKTRRTSAKQTTWGGLALAVLIALYSFARPMLNERMGWQLPAVTGNNAVVADSEPAKSTKLTPSKTSADANLLYGLLKDLGGDRYASPAGLMFTRGSAEGHRLDHLERHTEDDPSRPGKHGVFDGGMEGALKTIDLAYERAKTGSRTTKEVVSSRRTLFNQFSNTLSFRRTYPRSFSDATQTLSRLLPGLRLWFVRHSHLRNAG